MTEAEELLRTARAFYLMVRGPQPNEVIDGHISEIDAYLARPADGVVVPVEPTREMIEAGMKGIFNSSLYIDHPSTISSVMAIACYDAMLAAAPPDGKGGAV